MKVSYKGCFVGLHGSSEHRTIEIDVCNVQEDVDCLNRLLGKQVKVTVEEIPDNKVPISVEPVMATV